MIQVKRVCAGRGSGLWKGGQEQGGGAEAGEAGTSGLGAGTGAGAHGCHCTGGAAAFGAWRLQSLLRLYKRF